MLLIQLLDPFEAVGVFASIGLTLLTMYGGFVGVYWFQKKVMAPKGTSLDSGQHEALMDRLARLEEVEGRMAELEERVDFAERMLAQAKSEGVLPPGRQ